VCKDNASLKINSLVQCMSILYITNYLLHIQHSLLYMINVFQSMDHHRCNYTMDQNMFVLKSEKNAECAKDSWLYTIYTYI
jgi:hypothetical protein